MSTVRLQAPKSRVPTFPCQIVFIIGTPHYGYTKKGDSVPATNYDVIKHADMTDSITRAEETCQYILQYGGMCVCIRYSGAQYTCVQAMLDSTTDR